MWIPLENWEASSSFQEPVTPPTPEPDAAPLVCVSFNASWLPYVLASLMQLTQPASWDASPSAVLTVLDQATALIEQFIVGVDCVSALSFRFTAGCVLQYSLDGGTTWTDTPGWATFSAACFTGPTGPPGATGATGPPGPASIWRLSSCNLQYSNDGGTTWTTATGWSTDAIQQCLSGTPGNPQSVDTEQQACNIANWLAVEILQGSLSSAATSISAGATLLSAVTTLGGLALGFAALLDPFVIAAAAFYTAAVTIGAAALNAAASDSTLKADLTCAIYGAISGQGHVTSSNFSSMAAAIGAISYGTPAIIGLIHNYVVGLGYTGINGIQQEGSLYGGSCPGCGTWCWAWDFTVSNGGWADYQSTSVYVSGQGWEGTFHGDHTGPDITLHLGLTTTIHSVDVDVITPTALTNAGGFVTAVQVFASGSFVGQFAFNTAASSSVVRYSVAAGPYTGDQLYLDMQSPAHATGQFAVRVQVRGTGPNPFGTDNCT